MNHEVYEIPLVLFTVITQWGIGGVLALTLCQGQFNADWLRRIAAGLWFITALGSMASLAHLGSPAGAYRALYGLGHSWLSREVVVFGALNGVLTLWLLSIWRSPKWSRFLGYCASVVGIMAILVSVQVYAQMSLHPLWHSMATPLAFLGSALLLGFATISVLATALRGALSSLLCGGWLLGLGLVLAALFWRFQTPGANSASILFWWQIIASLLTGALALLWLKMRARPLAAGCLVLMLLVSGEIAGRMLFYSNVMSGAPWF